MTHLFFSPFAAALCVVCLVGSLSQAQPTVSVTNVGSNADGNLQWRVDIDPDSSLFSDGSGSLAAELGFELAGSTFLGAAINQSVWAFENPGFNPFSDSITVGSALTSDQLFVSYGSDPVSELVELMTITTQGSAATTLSWGGQSVRPGNPNGFTGGRIAQAGLNFDGLSGSLTAGTTVVVGDCNGDGVVNASDLVCACAGGTIDDVLSALGLFKGDLNGDGEVGFSDFLTLSGNFQFQNPEVGYSGGDIDCDGSVGFSDFLTLSANFGKSSAAAAHLATVPEPMFSTMFCAVACGLLLASRSKR